MSKSRPLPLPRGAPGDLQVSRDEHGVPRPSDRRFSRWYCSELEAWASGKFKRLVPDGLSAP